MAPIYKEKKAAPFPVGFRSVWFVRLSIVWQWAKIESLVFHRPTGRHGDDSPKHSWIGVLVVNWIGQVLRNLRQTALNTFTLVSGLIAFAMGNRVSIVFFRSKRGVFTCSIYFHFSLGCAFWFQSFRPCSLPLGSFPHCLGFWSFPCSLRFRSLGPLSLQRSLDMTVLFLIAAAIVILGPIAWQTQTLTKSLNKSKRQNRFAFYWIKQSMTRAIGKAGLWIWQAPKPVR